MTPEERLRVAGDRDVQALLPPRERCVTLPPGLPRWTLGYVALAWMESFLRIPSGPLAGQPFRASYDQALFLLWWYAVDENGVFYFQTGVRRLAKGTGKSPFAAAMALFELCGPCRFDGFDESLPGGVCGKPQVLPLVHLAATSESQTGVTMRVIRGMAHKRTALAKAFQLETGKTYVETPEGGKIQLLTSSATSAEGNESSFVVADETEHWTPSNGGDDMHATLKRNLAKTGARMLETCNAWMPGQDSVAEKTFGDWCDEQEGLLVEEATQGILYDARVAPSFVALTDQPGEDQVSLDMGLRFVYEHSPWADIIAIKNLMWKPSTKVSESRRFYLNQPNAADDAWCRPDEWAALADTGRELVDGEEVVLFFDGSKSNDHTALVGCCMSDGHVFTVGVWAPEESTGVVDVNAVDRRVRETVDRFTVVGFFGDVREFESYVKTSWPELLEEKDTLLVHAQEHGKAASLVAWDMRSHGYDFARASEECLSDIRAKSFTHDGNWVTAKHVGNCRVAERRGFWTVKKESPKSPKKIDAAVCVIGARMVYKLVSASDAWKSYQGESGDWTVWV